MVEKRQIRVGVSAMVFRDGKLLLSKRKSKLGEATWASCGGHIDFGETPEDAARRETKEECGLDVVSVSFISVSNIVEYGKHYIDIAFKVEVGPGEPQVFEPEKFGAWGWYDVDDLPEPLFRADAFALESMKTGSVYNS